MICPKCDEEQPGARACRRCGLAAARFDTFAADAGEAVSAEVVDAWQICLARWDDPEAHEAFAERAVSARAFSYAARQYRAALRRRPDDATARSRLDRVGKLAEAALVSAPARSRRVPAERAPYRGVVWLVVIGVFLAVGGAIVATLTGAAGEIAPEEGGSIRFSPETPQRAPPPP